jgi:hypothetical protein
MDGLFTGYNEYLQDAKNRNVMKAKQFGAAAQQIMPGMCFHMTTIKAENAGDKQTDQYVYIEKIVPHGVSCVMANQESTYDGDTLTPAKLTFYKKFYNSFAEVLYNDCVIEQIDAQRMISLVTLFTGGFNLDKPNANTKPKEVDESVYTGNIKAIAKEFEVLKVQPTDTEYLQNP